MKKEKFKVAIIGIGNQAIEDHIPGIKDSQFAELKAICDIDKIKVKEWSEKLKVKGYYDYHNLFNSESLDFVIISTPHDCYREIIEEAAKRKIHILKEKPFARNLKEAIYIKDLCEKNKIKLTTTLQRRFNPIYNSFFQLIEQIGKPFFVEAKYTLFVENPHQGWRGNKKLAGGGCILDMGYHLIDMIIWYFGLPDKISAEFSSKAKPEENYDAEDTAAILFSYKSGLHGSILLSRYIPPKTEYIKTIGDKGIIIVKRGSITRLKNNGEIVESLVRENSWPIAATNQIDYFCKVIDNKKENLGSPEYHLQHVSFVEACYKSKKEKSQINPKNLLKEALQNDE